MPTIMGSVGSWESGARNLDSDVRTVQELLKKISESKHKPKYFPGVADGKINRIASQSKTVNAIRAFQKMEVGMAFPDGRVDPNGKTWRALSSNSWGAPAFSRPISTVTVTFFHGGKIPQQTKFVPEVPATHAGLYDSRVVVSGGLDGTFSGSIWPDDMMVKGHLKDSTYPLHLGFHKGGGAAKQGSDKLVAATSGIRAGLLVNARNAVNVVSENPSKTTSTGINIHNGFSSQRFSDGCLTINPTDWSKFIQLFLNAFPNIDDWHALSTNTGKKIGEVVIRQ